MPPLPPLRALSTTLLAGVLALTPVATACGTADSPAGRTTPSDRRVLAITVDGLNPRALTRLGEQGAPTLHRLLAEGASTTNARTERERTMTLPNHTGMVTGRRIAATRRGHGVAWNSHRPGTTVQHAAGHEVASIFSVVDAAGGESAVFTGKEKFSLFPRSWPTAVDRFRLDEDPLALVRAARRDLVHHDRAFTLLHLATPDVVGHDHGFMSSRYLAAVARTDRLLAKVVRAVERDAELGEELVVLLTSDHGGQGTGHSDPTSRANYRVPFLAWGAGIAPADLYDLNPDYRDPGRRRTSYAGPQPVRNGDVANLAARLLDLEPVPGSRFGRATPLDVVR
ncbi:alkaline phosphatase family protein [Nocardioides sp. SYSU DS0663]|uniref:alkaline phosphatase family protein n=1 Tax=Nocardioides sp. SYSU DS0663 TaxID=3416445 RepID=UPI003F4B788F